MANQISFGDVNEMLGYNREREGSIGSPEYRALAGIPTGEISLSDFQTIREGQIEIDYGYSLSTFEGSYVPQRGTHYTSVPAPEGQPNVWSPPSGTSGFAYVESKQNPYYPHNTTTQYDMYSGTMVALGNTMYSLSACYGEVTQGSGEYAWHYHATGQRNLEYTPDPLTGVVTIPPFLREQGISATWVGATAVYNSHCVPKPMYVIIPNDSVAYGASFIAVTCSAPDAVGSVIVRGSITPDFKLEPSTELLQVSLDSNATFAPYAGTGLCPDGGKVCQLLMKPAYAQGELISCMIVSSTGSVYYTHNIWSQVFTDWVLTSHVLPWVPDVNTPCKIYCTYRDANNWGAHQTTGWQDTTTPNYYVVVDGIAQVNGAFNSGWGNGFWTSRNSMVTVAPSLSTPSEITISTISSTGVSQVILYLPSTPPITTFAHNCNQAQLVGGSSGFIMYMGFSDNGAGVLTHYSAQVSFDSAGVATFARWLVDQSILQQQPVYRTWQTTPDMLVQSVNPATGLPISSANNHIVDSLEAQKWTQVRPAISTFHSRFGMDTAEGFVDVGTYDGTLDRTDKFVLAHPHLATAWIKRKAVNEVDGYS